MVLQLRQLNATLNWILSLPQSSHAMLGKAQNLTHNGQSPVKFLISCAPTLGPPRLDLQSDKCLKMRFKIMGELCFEHMKNFKSAKY